MKIGSVLTLVLCVFAVAPAAAQSGYQAAEQTYHQEDQNACMSDAMTVCSQFIPDRSRVAGCLMHNRTRVSPPCRAQLAHWHG
jgi:hypothetical protein